MEHIVQFAVRIDDEAIEKRIIENAERNITNDIKQNIYNKIFEANIFNYSKNANPKIDPLSRFSMNILDDFISENKEAIIDCAGKYLAEKLARTKAGKELIEKIGDNK